MLILSRRADESIRISDEVKITVLGIQGKQVRLGISAPDDVGVFREELYLKSQANQPTARKLANTGKDTEPS